MSTAGSLRSLTIAVWVMVVFCIGSTVLVFAYLFLEHRSRTPTPVPAPAPSPVPTGDIQTHAKRRLGKSMADLEVCLRASRPGCEKIVVFALADAAPYTRWTEAGGWEGLEIDLVRAMARELFGEGVDLTRKIDIVRAATTQDRLKLARNIDVDFSIGAITDDVADAATSRRAQYRIDFTRSHATDSYGILLRKGNWAVAPTSFCDKRLSDGKAMLIELSGATGDLRQYQDMCKQAATAPEWPRTLPDVRKPTSIGDAIGLVRATNTAFFLSDAAVLSARMGDDASLSLLRRAAASRDAFRIGFAVREEEGGWRALLESSLQAAKTHGRLDETCAKFARYFAAGGILVCNKSWSP